MSYVSKRFVVEDVTVVALLTDTQIVVSGGVVEDEGLSTSSVVVTACKYIIGRSARVAPAVTGLTVEDTGVVYVDTDDNTIKADATLPSGMVPLASCAVLAEEVTPTDTRRMLGVVVDGTPE